MKMYCDSERIMFISLVAQGLAYLERVLENSSLQICHQIVERAGEL
jgi:hypothetical protein